MGNAESKIRKLKKRREGESSSSSRENVLDEPEKMESARIEDHDAKERVIRLSSSSPALLDAEEEHPITTQSLVPILQLAASDLFHFVFTFFDTQTLLTLQKTCRSLNAIIKEKRHLLRKQTSITVCVENQIGSWRRSLKFSTRNSRSESRFRIQQVPNRPHTIKEEENLEKMILEADARRREVKIHTWDLSMTPIKTVLNRVLAACSFSSLEIRCTNGDNAFLEFLITYSQAKTVFVETLWILCLGNDSSSTVRKLSPTDKFGALVLNLVTAIKPLIFLSNDVFDAEFLKRISSLGVLHEEVGHLSMAGYRNDGIFQ